VVIEECSVQRQAIYRLPAAAMPDRYSELSIILEQSICRLRVGRRLGLLDGLLAKTRIQRTLIGGALATSEDQFLWLEIGSFWMTHCN
jgi:hypothetical protein